MRKKGAKINRDAFFNALQKRGITFTQFLELYKHKYGIISRTATSSLRKKILYEKQMNFDTIDKIANVLGVDLPQLIKND